MKYSLSLIILSIGIAMPSLSQQPKLWKENDRNYLVSNLINSRDELIKETGNLTEQQWNFKESPDRWSIKEVVEHVDIWELLMQHEINMALSSGPLPDYVKTADPDSVIYNFIMEEKPHIATDFTRPFTFSVPMGLNSGKTNMAWLVKMRNESIHYLQTTNDDLRLYFLKEDSTSVHQIYILIFGHTNRHLRQIKKIKQASGYPR